MYHTMYHNLNDQNKAFVNQIASLEAAARLVKLQKQLARLQPMIETLRKAPEAAAAAAAAAETQTLKTRLVMVKMWCSGRSRLRASLRCRSATHLIISHRLRHLFVLTFPSAFPTNLKNQCFNR
jgi:hypothetical protein